MIVSVVSIFPTAAESIWRGVKLYKGSTLVWELPYERQDLPISSVGMDVALGYPSLDADMVEVTIQAPSSHRFVLWGEGDVNLLDKMLPASSEPATVNYSFGGTSGFKLNPWYIGAGVALGILLLGRRK